MTAFTSKATGNWSSGGTTTWNQSGTPGAGDTVLIQSGHAITVDVNSICGMSLPNAPSTLLVTSTSTGGTVTSLPTGTYRVGYTQVDSGGNESASIISTVSTGALTNGSSKPRVTFPALPTGVSSYNLYLTNTGGADGTEHLYATGISTTTYDLVSASWNNGTQSYASAAALPANYACKVLSTGTLKVVDGVTLEVRGELWLKNTSLTLDQAAIVEFNASNAVSASNTRYGFWFGDGNTQTSTKLQTTNTSSSKIAQVRSNSGGGFARMLPYVTAFGDAIDTVFVNVSYCNFIRIGDGTRDAIKFVPSATSFVQTFANCIFNTCGRLNFSSNAPAGAGWSFTNCSWKSSASTCLNLAASAALTTGTRLVDHCVFDGLPNLATKSATYTNTIFDTGFGNIDANAWTTFDSNLIRNNTASNLSCAGDMTNCINIFSTLPSINTSGTAAGTQTSTTLQDSGAAWTVNGFAAGATGITNGWTVVITGGTGAGQARLIISNTSKILTVNRAWDTIPVAASSTYAIYAGVANPHMMGFDKAVASSTVNITGNIFILADSGDNNGDMMLHLDSSAVTYNIKNNLMLPNIARDQSGTITLGPTDNNQSYNVEHNTIFMGGQAGLDCNEGAGFQTVTSGSSTTVVNCTTASGAWTSNGGSQLKFRNNTTTVALRGVTRTMSSVVVATSVTVNSALSQAPVSGDQFAYTIQPGIIKSYRSNIYWCESGATYILGGASTASGIGPFKIGATPNSPAFSGNEIDYTQDEVLVSGGVTLADYNCGYGHRTDGYADTQHAGGGNGYNVNSSVQMGTHDVNGDPNFVDRWRNLATWATSLGISGSDPIALWSSVRSQLLAINDPSDANYNASATIAALYTYLRNGFVVQNASLNNAGHDSVTIGAMGFSSTFTPRRALIGVGV